jgi:hypothetical protein
MASEGLEKVGLRQNPRPVFEDVALDRLFADAKRPVGGPADSLRQILAPSVKSRATGAFSSFCL